MAKFSSDLYTGAQSIAMDEGQIVISEKAVHDFSMLFIPHKINEFEDARFFPKLEKNLQIYLESYDMDAFRDAGIHWQYLAQGVFADDFKLYL